MLKFMSHQPRSYVNSILFILQSIDTRHSQIYSSILEDTHIYIPHTSYKLDIRFSDLSPIWHHLDNIDNQVAEPDEILSENILHDTTMFACDNTIHHAMNAAAVAADHS